MSLLTICVFQLFITIGIVLSFPSHLKFTRTSSTGRGHDVHRCRHHPPTLDSMKKSGHGLGKIQIYTRVSMNSMYHTTVFVSEQTRLYSNKNADTGRDDKSLWNGIVNLWDEIIEVSTYGPSERKMLKAQRERQKKLADMDLDLDRGDTNIDLGDDRAWMEAFTAAKDKNQGDADADADTEGLDYDGYALQDLLVSKWGVSLDVDFQRIGEKIYCTVLPVIGFGSPLKSRHDSELDYLMHLQGIVEILHRYDNLDGFIAFVQSTSKVPKRGTDSVPFRLDLSREEVQRIMQR